MSEPQSIWFLARGPHTDAPMFYPPGCHPAMAREREVLARLEALGQGQHDMAHWLRDKLSAFEARESDIKAQYAAMLAEEDARP